MRLHSTSPNHRRGHAVAVAALLAFLLLADCQPGNAGGDAGTSSPTPATDTSPSAEKGTREARESIAAGHLKLKEWPPIPYPADHGEYVALLRDRCHVEYEVSRPSAGVTEADHVKAVRAWNLVMSAEIERRFGAGIFDRLQDDAHKKWEKSLGR